MFKYELDQEVRLYNGEMVEIYARRLQEYIEGTTSIQYIYCPGPRQVSEWTDESLIDLWQETP